MANIKVTITKRYKDLELGRVVETGEELTMTPERAEQVIEAGFAKKKSTPKK